MYVHKRTERYLNVSILPAVAVVVAGVILTPVLVTGGGCLLAGGGGWAAACSAPVRRNVKCDINGEAVSGSRGVKRNFFLLEGQNR